MLQWRVTKSEGISNMPRERLFTSPRSLIFSSILSIILSFNPLIANPSSALIAPVNIAMEQQQPTAAMNLPEAVETAVRKDLARRTQIPPEQFKLQSARRETWPDGCLGLGKPEELCTQSLVSGWRVEMTYHHQVWVYRTNQTGTNLRTGDTKTNLVD